MKRIEIFEEVEGEGYFAYIDSERKKIVLFDPFVEDFTLPRGAKVVGAVDPEEIPPKKIWIETDFFGPAIVFALPEKFTKKLKEGTPPGNVLAEFFTKGFLEKRGVPKVLASKLGELLGEEISIEEISPDFLERFCDLCTKKLGEEEKEPEEIFTEVIEDIFRGEHRRGKSFKFSWERSER